MFFWGAVWLPFFLVGYSRTTIASRYRQNFAFGPKLAPYLFVPIKYYRADVYQVYIDFQRGISMNPSATWTRTFPKRVPKAQMGFSLIELLIVVSIILI